MLLNYTIQSFDYEERIYDKMNKRGTFSEMKRWSVAEWILFVILAAQVAAIVVFNFTRMKYCMDYDSICALTQAREIWRQKTLALSSWTYQTTLGWDSGVPLAALLYGVTKNLFVSYGIVNCLFTFFYIYVFVRLFRDLKMGNIGRFVILIILFAPYTFDQLGYSKMLFTAAAYYNVKAVMSVMMLGIIVRFRVNARKKQILFCCLFELFLFASSISTTVYELICCVAPVVLFEVIDLVQADKLFEGNRFRLAFLRSREILFVLASVVVAVAGLALCRIAGLQINPPVMNLTDQFSVWKNMGACFASIYAIFGGVPLTDNIPVMSPEGITSLICFLIVSFVLASLIYMMVCLVRKKVFDVPLVIISCFVVVNLAVLILADLTYGGGFFESRYHLLPIMVVLVCAGMVAELLAKKVNKSMRLLLFCTFTVCVLAANVANYTRYFLMDNHADELEHIIEDARAENVRMLYVMGADNLTDGRVMKSLSDELPITVSEDGVIGYENGVFTGDFDNAAAGQEVCILLTPEAKDQIPAYLLQSVYPVKTYDYKGYTLYRTDSNIIDFRAGLPAKGRKKSVDYPYTFGYYVNQAKIDPRGMLVTDGTQQSGYVLYGPNTKVIPGRYKIRVKYRISPDSSRGKPFFDVAVNNGNEICAKKVLNADSEQVVLHDVEIPESEPGVEFRLYVPNGIKIEFEKIIIERQTQ